MRKHTKEPLVYALHDPTVEIATVAHVGDYVVGIATPGYPGGDYRDIDMWGNDEADARLFAAAPVMFEALEDAYRALNDACTATAIYGDQPPQMYLDAADKAIAALRAATGES